MKKELNKKEFTPYNVLNNRVAKVALSASLLLTGVTTTISTAGPNNGIIGEMLKINQAEASGFFAGGTGTVSDPYLIEDSNQLLFLGNFSTSHFKLIKDISLSDMNWIPIQLFEGTLDGNNYTISDFKYSGASGALFMNLKNATVKDLNIDNIQNVSNINASALAITAVNSNFENITVKGIIKAASVGGLVQTMTNSNAENISVDLSIDSKGQSGGIVASASGGTFKNIYSTGVIKHKSSGKVGGLIGAAIKNTQVENGISTMYMDIENSVNSGGLFGSFSGVAKNLYALNEFSKVNVLVNEKAIGLLVSPSNISNIYAPSNSFVNSSFNNVTQFFTPSTEISDMQADYGVLLNDSKWEIKEGLNYPIPSNVPSSFEMAPLKLDSSDNLIIENGITVNLVKNRADLENIKYNLAGNYVLQNDIDLTGELWTPIGTGLYSPEFTGKINGNGFTIKGLTIRDTSKQVGFFKVTKGGKIENVNFTNVDVQGAIAVGSIAGELGGTTLNKVSVKGTVKGKWQIGGLAGFGSSPTLKEVYTNLDISGTVNTSVSYGDSNIGGFFGQAYGKVTIHDSYLKGSVSATGPAVGGIIGYMNEPILNIKNVYVANGVSSNTSLDYVGGAFGEMKTNSSTYNSKTAVVENLFILSPYIKNNSAYSGGRYTALGSFSNFTNKGIIASEGIRFYKNSVIEQSPTSGLTQSIQESQALQRNTYLLKNWNFGVFGDEAVWGIDEGQTYPYLLFNPEKSMYNHETGNWEETDSTLEEEATTAVVNAEKSKTQTAIKTAKDLVGKLPNGEVKTDLTNRLDALQKLIDADKALQDAKDAVDNLGDHPTQEELDAAKDKVDALPDSPEKEELLNQIKDKQDALDQENPDETLAEQIAKATEAVVKAEGSQTQVDMDTARDLVSKLPNGEVKNDLTDRLNAIKQVTDEDKALEEAKDAVDNLGDNPTQEEIDKAKDKVDELSDGPAKDALLDEVKEKQEALNQATAIKAVEKAEISKTQVDVNAARDLVKKLSDGEVKTDLTNRLDVLQQAIDAAKHLEEVRSLVNNLGDNPTQVKIDQARSAVESLSDSLDKMELHAKVKSKQEALDVKVADAREAVEAISTPPTLEELASAQEKVNVLPAGDIKNDLQKQINDKKKQLDDISDQLAKAEAAVTKAESFPTNYNVTIATKLVEALPDSAEKTVLEERLQAIQDVFDLEKAEAKVKQAENYERDPYLADAIAIVDALKDSAGKQSLKERIQVILDKLQAIKDAEEAEKDANGAYDPADPNQSIEDAIDTIQDPAAKKYFTNWNKAVTSAENFFSKTTVKNATKYLTELPDAYTLVASYENIIQELTERTQNLKAEEVAVDIFAPVEKAVAMYEKFQSTYYLKKATEAVQALPNSPEKTAFEIRLGLGDGNGTPGNEQTEEEKLAAQLASVEKAVSTYEKYKTNFYQKKATQAVEALTDSEAKAAFQARLDAVIK